LSNNRSQEETRNSVAVIDTVSYPNLIFKKI
jgi:hypothetical protein